LKIALVAKSCEHSGAAGLASCLSKLDDVSATLLYHIKSPYKFFSMFPRSRQYGYHREYYIEKIISADWILMMGWPAVERHTFRMCESPLWKGKMLPHPHEWLSKRKVACFATGGVWFGDRVKYEECKGIFNKISTLVFATPDKFPLVEFSVPTYPYFQPVETVEVEKSKTILLSHSPGLKIDEDVKGTAIIRDIFKRICKEYSNVKYEILSGLSYKECIVAKAKAHIFVDQFIPNYTSQWSGGLGKSGLEAMAAGCATITTGKLSSTRLYFPECPVLLVSSKDELYHIIRDLVIHPNKLTCTQQMHKTWIEKYASPECVAEHVMGILKAH